MWADPPQSLSSPCIFSSTTPLVKPRPHSINVACIGCGYWGEKVMQAILANKTLNLISLFDSNPRTLHKMRKKYTPKKSASSIQEILKDKDIYAIFVITPPKTHYLIVQSALLAQKHVFVEKPLCMREEEALELYELANKRNLILHSDLTFLYSPAIQWIKTNISTLGKILYINCRRMNLGIFQNDVDVIWDLAIHDLSIIEYLVGLQIQDMHINTKTHPNHSINSIANISLELKNGIMVHIHNSWFGPSKIREVILGTQKTLITYDDTQEKKLSLLHVDPSNLMKDIHPKTKLFTPYITQTPALDNSIENFIFKINHPKDLENEKHQICNLKIIQTLCLIQKAQNQKHNSHSLHLKTQDLSPKNFQTLDPSKSSKPKYPRTEYKAAKSTPI